MMSSSRMPCAVIRRNGGFTLVELMIVVAVLAALMSVGAPSFMEWIQNSRIRSAAESLQNGLQIARAEAVRRNTNVEFVLQGESGGWTVQLQQGAIFVQGSPAEGGGKVTVASTPAGATMLTYNGVGRVSTAAAVVSAPITQLVVDLPAEVLAASKTRELRVTVGVGGEIRMCDPDASLPADDPRRC